MIFKNNIFSFCVILILFSFCFKGFSQSQKTYSIPDSLKDKTYKEIDKLIEKCLNKNDLVKELFYSRIYLHKAKNEYDTIKIANGYSKIGSVLDNNISVKYFDSIIATTKNLNHYVYPGYAYMAKGMIYFKIGKYNSSIDNYLIAQKYATKNNNKHHLFFISGGIADIKRVWGSYDEAIKIYKSILNESKHYSDSHLGMIYSIANCYINLNRLDTALTYTKKGIKESLKKDDEYWYYSFVKQAGYILYNSGDLISSIDSINKGAVYDDTPNSYLNTYYYKGNIFKKQNKSVKAFNNFKKADSIYDANPKDIVPEIKDIQEYFVKYYGKKKDITNQLKYIDRLLRVDSIMDSYKKNLNETITKEYDRPRLLAEKQSIINTLERKKTKSRIFNEALITLLILLSGFTIRFYYMQNVYKNRFKNLVNTNAIEEEVVIKPKGPLQNISQDIVNSILKQLEQFENNNTFLDKNITLSNLAKSYNTNSSYLSKVINHYKQNNFNTYLSSLRIEYSINTLKTDKTLRSYTIKAIANEMGFKNSESFSKAFFKTTGIYPSFFIKQTEKHKKVA